MARQLDVLFVNPDSAFLAYQGLGATFAAIEPPTWALLLAQSCRAQGYGVAILDCGAEHLSISEAVTRIADTHARLVCFVMYGQNPNSGTTSMIGAEILGAALRLEHPNCTTCFVGSHVSALPKEVLSKPYVDIVLLNEGVYALHNLLKTNLRERQLALVKGIGYKREGRPILNPPERLVPNELMDIDLPGYAWDLLPYRDKPLDLYRSHFWHAEYDPNKRTPFAAIYTSLGCQFKCSFCMVNIVNRMNNDDGIVASDSAGMRFWSPEFILREFEALARMGVETVRISDEMFFLQRKLFEPLLQGLIDRQLALRMWAYSRVDSVNMRYLDLFKHAGVGWLALGIEAGAKEVRMDASKGSFGKADIPSTVNAIREHGLNVIGNYIFGLPEDTPDTMQRTLDLALELNTEAANFYPCQALPGTPLYNEALMNGSSLPTSYAGYAFLSYDCEPLSTRYCSAADVLRFRDNAWQKYHTDSGYLALIERKFGPQQRTNIEAMAGITLRRRILGDPPP